VKLTKRVKQVRYLYIFLCALMLATTALLAGCGSSNTLQSGYYRQIIMQPNGEFIVKGKLSDSEAKKAGISFKVDIDEVNKGQPRKITAMYNGTTVRNTRWFLLELLETGRFASISITFEKNGYTKYTFYDAAGRTCKGFFDAYSMRFQKDSKDQKLPPKTAYLYDEHDKDKGHLLFTYDKEHRLQKISYTDSNGQAKGFSGSRSVKALQISYDKKGHMAALSWQNDAGYLVKSSSGYAKVTFTYDDKGRIIERNYFGPDGRPINPALRYRMDQTLAGGPNVRSLEEALDGLKHRYILAGAINKYAYSKDGLYPVKLSFFGPQGQSLNAAYGAEVHLTYDEFGNITKMTTKGTDSRLRGFAGSIDTMALTYDDKGNIVKEKFYANNTPASLRWGRFDQSNHVAEIRYTYDDAGRAVSEAFYTGAGQPTDIKLDYFSRFHKAAYSYDKNAVDFRRTRYYQTDGTQVFKLR